MSDPLKKYLQGLLDSVDGLLKIFVTDKEGIPIVYSRSSSSADNYPRPNLLTSHSVMVGQSSKLGLGNQRHILCLYQNFQLIILNLSPLTVTLIAAPSANTGQILALRNHLEPLIKQLQGAVAEALPRND